MFKFKLTLIIMIWSMTIIGYASDQQGFDEVCCIYTEAKNSNMSIATASKYVMENISRRVDSKDALQAHEAIMQAMADQRYILFKQSAEHVLKKSWECEAMKSMFKIKVK